MGLVTTEAYDIANAQTDKDPIIVLEFDGVDVLVGSGKIYTKLRYDDPDVYYDGTYNYDGLRPVEPSRQLTLIDRKGSDATISQKLEQWDGKASIGTFTLKLVDANQFFTRLCSPGFLVEEILNRRVKISYGFKSISFPEDYLRLFEGYINSYRILQGSVVFTFTDPSSKRKVELFNSSTSRLVGAITNSQTTLTVSSTDNFYKTITNAKGIPDTGVTIGLVLDGKEIVTYTNADIISQTQVNVVRGQFGTQAVAHDDDIKTQMFISLTDNPVNIALKTMLSGWNGPWKEDVTLRGIINTDDGGTLPDSITFKQGVDLIRDYGLSIGDFITITNALIPTNNDTFTIANFKNDNRTVVVREVGVLTQEDPPTGFDLAAVAAFRSKYDVYPITAGLGLSTDDVLVSQHEYNRDTFVKFPFTLSEIAEVKSGKSWIETKIFKAIGGYSLTQGARISMGLTHAPLANDLTKFIDPTNVIDPGGIEVTRGLNTRFFYNEVFFEYDYDVIKDEFYRSIRFIDADAQNRMNQVSVLSIQMHGLDDSPASINIMKQRAERILQRYKFGSELIELKTQFGVGHTIDSGDTAILRDTDNPILQIANTDTGSRGIKNRVMEVQERHIDTAQGYTKLSLLSNNGFSFSDRYGVVSPSSWIDTTWAGTTNTMFKIKESFGGLVYPGAEYLKWESYEGYYIKIHNKDYSLNEIVTFTLDLSDPFIVHVSPALSFVPNTEDFVMEFEDYDATDANRNALIKATFVSYDPVGVIFSASSETVFVLESGYSTKYQAGMIVYVMSPDGTSRYSPDLKIISVIGDVVTVGPIFPSGGVQDLGFIPQPGDLVQLGGFRDNGSGYRYV